MRLLGLPGILGLLLLAPAARSQTAPRPPAAPPEIPRPFDRGSMNLGLALGISTGHGTSVSLGADFGYFVLPGLEPGLEAGVTFGSDRPTLVSLMPYLRWVIWRSYGVSPFLKLQGGHWFIAGQADLSPLGGGGGLVIFLTRIAALQLEGMVYRLFPSDACPADGCVATSVGLSLGFYFGGRPRPAAPPPPVAAPLVPPPPPGPAAPPPPASRAAEPPGSPAPEEPGLLPR